MLVSQHSTGLTTKATSSRAVFALEQPDIRMARYAVFMSQKIAEPIMPQDFVKGRVAEGQPLYEFRL